MSNEIEQGPDGLFGICIFNAESCSDDEVRDIFGKFGEVAKINRSQKLSFVRYKSLDEATKCIESMRNDLKFNVRPAKNKTNSDRFDSQRSRNNFEGSHRNSEMNRRNYGSEDSRGRRNESSENFSHQHDSKMNSLPPMPRLVPVQALPTADEDKANMPLAHLVVVGNLNPNTKQCSVYEMCTKSGGKPLHVAMKKINKPGHPHIYYAFVYLRTEKEVKSVVEGLNNLKVNGYQLIVDSKEKMVEGGKTVLKSKK